MKKGPGAGRLRYGVPRGRLIAPGLERTRSYFFFLELLAAGAGAGLLLLLVATLLVGASVFLSLVLGLHAIFQHFSFARVNRECLFGFIVCS